MTHNASSGKTDVNDHYFDEVSGEWVGKSSAAASAPYPTDWHWSADFSAAGTATAVDGHGFEYQIGSGPTQESDGVKYVNLTGKAASYYGANVGSLPSTSGDLSHGASIPGSSTKLALNEDRYLTVYFQIIHASDSTPTSVYGAEFFYSTGTSAQYNPTGIVPLNTVRKTGSHKGTVTTAGTYANGEFISVTYDMPTQADGDGKTWGSAPIVPVWHIGGSSATGWAGGSIIVHGYVLSDKTNGNTTINTIDLPIKVS